ncbi:cold shock domain-containing protein [Motiliproteus coralliicola]|uniref:Cold shock domain-containing protein n=1 Tax=Motiliproteus coralliicola TaxID=2283196 RepID=A0A369WD11_9GAMM|nr:cold shock domain-containing protein [Motiliproteus coralliicola]RDE19920.1 cold shock domain-containing protein [Motiliproteus coralliicola]
MKTKTMLLGAVYSGVVAAAVGVIHSMMLKLPSENVVAAMGTVFVLTLIASLMTAASASGTSGSAQSSSSRVNGGAEVISASEANDDREGGVVKWFNVTKGFGFITRDQGDDVFVHFRSIRGTGHRSLSEGQRVKFEVVQSDKGLQAEDVSVIA